MLRAVLNGDAIDAHLAERGLDYRCPNPDCSGPMTLKRGRIKIAHFAHQPPTTCSWAKGETQAHLKAKAVFREAFASQGMRAEVEYVVKLLPGDRRADVMVWSSVSKRRAAIELQHTSISPEHIEKRAFSYARGNIAQAWIPFLTSKIKATAKRGKGGDAGDLVIQKYPPRPFERWAHMFHFGRLWFYDPELTALWRGHFDEHQLNREDTTWFESDGTERSEGGYSYPSKRWKQLTLWGPYEVHQVRINIKSRKAYKTKYFNIPGGPMVDFVAKEE